MTIHAAYGTRDKTAKCCGTCEHSFGNSSAAGIRLGCWRGYVSWFAMPDDLVCKGKDWAPRLRFRLKVSRQRMSEPEFIFTRTSTRGHRQQTAHKRPIAHTPMDRWVRCMLVGGEIIVKGDPRHESSKDTIP